MTYAYTREPKAHQREALETAAGRDAFAYLMEMGTGKTKVILDEFGTLLAQKKVDDMLVIAPKGVYANWEREILLDLDAKSIKVARWISGKKFPEEFIKHKKGPRIFLMNIEALQKQDKAYELCAAFLSQRRAYMIVDESTRIKSPDAKRTKNIIRLGGLAKVRRIATGSPATNSPLDLYSQFAFLRDGILGFNSYFAFRARYAVLKDMDHGGRKFKVVVGHKNVDELADRIKPHSFRRTKEECLDLPPKVYMPLREVPLTDEQKRLYNEIKEFATTELDGSHVTATAVITQILRLHQILCGHVTDEQKNVRPVSSNRLSVLGEYLEEASGKSIIWANYQYSLAELAHFLREEYGPSASVEYWGQTSDDARVEAVERFQTDKACRFFIGNPQVGGMGLTLTAANHVVYYSNNYNLEHRIQSEDRAHRAGLVHSVDYTDLCAIGTVDEIIIKALREKINIAATINGDNYREWLI